MTGLSLLLFSCFCFLACQVVAGLSTVQCFGKTNLESMNIVILVDTSKSMISKCDDKNILQTTVLVFLHDMTNALTKHNSSGTISMALISFDAEVKPEVRVNKWGTKPKINFKEEWFSTDMPSAVDEATKYLVDSKFVNRTRMIILITNAGHNQDVDDQEKRLDIAEKAKQHHVHIITLFANTTIPKGRCTQNKPIDMRESRIDGIRYAKDILSNNPSMFMIVEKGDEAKMFSFIQTQICIITNNAAITTTTTSIITPEETTTSFPTKSGQGTAGSSDVKCFNKTDLDMNIVFLVDNSNSMGKLCDKKKVLITMKDFLNRMVLWLNKHNGSETINAALVTFNDKPTVDVRFNQWTVNFAKNIIKKIKTEGSTIMSTAVRTATELLLNQKFVNRTRIIILITDAGFRDEDKEEQIKVAHNARSKDIYIITLFANTSYSFQDPCGNNSAEDYKRKREKGMEFAKDTLSYNSSMFMTIENFNEDNSFKFVQTQICKSVPKPKPIIRFTPAVTPQVTSVAPIVECATKENMDIVFLVGVSYSMTKTKPKCDEKNVFTTIKKFLIRTTDWISKHAGTINAALVEFHYSPEILIKFNDWTAYSKNEILKLGNSITTVASNVKRALRGASEMLLRPSIKLNRTGVIILIADVEFHPTEYRRMVKLAHELRDSRIYVITLYANTTIGNSYYLDCCKTSNVDAREEFRRKGIEFAKNRLSYNSSMFMLIENFDTNKVLNFLHTQICITAKLPKLAIKSTTTTTSTALITTTTTTFKEITTTSSTTTSKKLATTSKPTTFKEIVSTLPEAVSTTASTTTSKKVITTPSAASTDIVTASKTIKSASSATTDDTGGTTTSPITPKETTTYKSIIITSPSTSSRKPTTTSKPFEPDAITTTLTITPEQANASTLSLMPETAIINSTLTSKEINATLSGTPSEINATLSEELPALENDTSTSLTTASQSNTGSTRMISNENTMTLIGTQPMETTAVSPVATSDNTNASWPIMTSEISSPVTYEEISMPSPGTTPEIVVEASSTNRPDETKATSPVTTSKTGTTFSSTATSEEITTKLPVTAAKNITTTSTTTTKPVITTTTTMHKPIIMVTPSASSSKATTTSKPFEPHTPPKGKTTTTSSTFPKETTTTTAVMINTTTVANKSLTTMAGADDNNSGLGVGAIIGIIIGALVVLGAIIGIAYYLLQPASSAPMATKGGAKGTEAGVEADEQSMAPSKKR